VTLELTITDSQEVLAFDVGRFAADVRALAEGAGFSGDLSLAVVDDVEIHRINREFLDHDWPTDVIAFPLAEDDAEIVVSAERALAEAESRGVEPMAELLLYVVHGLLHLVGHDDHDPEDARRMHEHSLNLLRSLGYRNTIPPEEMGGKEPGRESR
jgi:probable rRNA maturation factor